MHGCMGVCMDAWSHAWSHGVMHGCMQGSPGRRKSSGAWSSIISRSEPNSASSRRIATYAWWSSTTPALAWVPHACMHGRGMRACTCMYTCTLTFTLDEACMGDAWTWHACMHAPMHVRVVVEPHTAHRESARRLGGRASASPAPLAEASWSLPRVQGTGYRVHASWSLHVCVCMHERMHACVHACMSI